MKKILSLLFLSSSLFSMQLALKMQTPRFDRVKSAVVKQQKAIISQTNLVTSKIVDTPKVQIDGSSIRAPHSLSDIKLYHDRKGFVVFHDDKKHVIEKCFMDKTARSISKEGLKSFLKTGYFALNQTNDGTFTLKAHHRLLGGGPLFGGFMYWLTKSVCYGGLAAVAGTAVVGTGGAVAGSAGTVTALAIAGNSVTGAIIGTAGATTVGTTIVTTAGVGVGVASTAGAVATGTGAVVAGLGATAAGAAATNAAAVTTGAVLATGASTGGIIVGIEALSIAIGTFFGMSPTP